MSVTVGRKGRAESAVTAQNTADAVGSGLVPVFATPYMVALMENAAVNAVQEDLEPGQGTVGTRLDVTHDAATPVGMKVWAESTVTAINGRKVSFSITAYDETGVIGTCDHQRAIIDNEKFFTRCQNKLSH